MIAEILHRLMSMKEREVERGPFFFRPSMSGPERCIRQLTYAARGFQAKEIPGRTLMIFSTGNWNEEVLVDLIDQTSFRLHSRQLAVTCWRDDDLVLTGHIDGVVTDPLDADFLWETKSCNHFSWQRWALGDSLPEDYLTQCAMYLRGLHDIVPDCRQCILTLRNKNTDQLCDLLLSYDWVGDRLTVDSRTLHTGEVIPCHERRERIVQQAVEKFKEVAGHARAGTLPSRPESFTSGEFPCSYCPFQETCWSGYVVETTAGGEVVLADPNAEVWAEQYLILVAQAKDAEASKASHRDRLLTILRSQQAIIGTAGQYTVTRSIQERAGKINDEMLDATTKAKIKQARGPDVVVEVLKVRKRNTVEKELREEGV